MHVRRLEEQLECELFIKQGRGARLSADGERLVEHARRMLQVEAAALFDLKAQGIAGRVVLGPGTGLGVAGLVYAMNHWIPVPGEGGHMDIGPRSPRDFEVFPHREKLEGRISGEQILCGRGLVNLYRAVAKADKKPSPFTTPAEIMSQGSPPRSTPCATDAIRLACGASRAFGCSGVLAPIP